MNQTANLQMPEGTESRLATLSSIIQILSSISSPEKMFQACRRLLDSELDHDRFFLHLRKAQGDFHGVLRDGTPIRSNTQLASHFPCKFANGNPAACRCCILEQVEVPGDHEDSPGIADQLCTPIFSPGNEHVGCLGTDNLTNGTPLEQKDQQTYDLLASFVGAFLANKQQAMLSEEKERWMQTAVNHLPSYLYVKDCDSRFLLANEKLAAEMGVPDPDSLIGKTDHHFYPPELAEKYRRDEQQILATGQPMRNFLERAQNSKGKDIWVLSTKIPIKNDQGDVVGLVGTGVDVTDRKLAEDRLTESEQRFRAIIESARDVILLYNAEGQLQHSNSAAESVFGYTESELQQLEFSRLVNKKQFQSNGLEGGSVQMGCRKNGESFPVEVSSSRVKMNRRWLTVHTIRDVSDREEAMGNTLKLRAAIEQSNDGFIISDPLGKIVYVNQGYETITGFSKQEAVEQLWISPAHSDNQSIHPWGDTDLRKKANWKSSRNAVKRDGRHYHEDSTTFPIYTAASSICNYVTIIRDVTEERAMESNLRHAQKLESVGQLAAGIAHEINTPIQFISDNLYFLRNATEDLLKIERLEQKLFSALERGEIPSDLLEQIKRLKEEADMNYLLEEIPKAIEQSSDGTQRVATIVLAMKDFAHPGSIEFEPTDLNSAIKTTVTVARNEWKYVANLDLDLAPDLPLVPCIASEINQVILNLIVNASDAISEHHGSSGPVNLIRISTRMLDSQVEIRISDNGGGIPEEVQERIFDPFFTTKEVGKGSGQGLAIAHSVVTQKHGGELFFETIPGKGTTFIVRLPHTQH